MDKLIKQLIVILLVVQSQPTWALDSYRYLHVTIETPWLIFLFLLPIVLSPFILMAILYWNYALRKPAPQPGESDEEPKE